MQPSKSLIDEFLAILRTRLARFENVPSDVADELRRVLRAWPATPYTGHTAEPHSGAVAKHLSAALTLAETGDAAELAASIRPLADALHWTFGYKPHPLFPDLESRVAFAQLVGPSGGMPSGEQLLMGLTLLAPHTMYPAHRHPAHEIYLPVGGTGLWRKGSAAAALKPPGSIILHPSNVAHATEALSEPVLAIYIWRGDLTSESTFVMNPVNAATGATGEVGAADAVDATQHALGSLAASHSNHQR